MGASSKGLDPRINLYCCPNSFLPINIFHNQFFNKFKATGLEYSKYIATTFSWPQGNEQALFLKYRKPSQVLLSKRGPLFESIVTVCTPKDKSFHDLALKSSKMCALK